MAGCFSEVPYLSSQSFFFLSLFLSKFSIKIIPILLRVTPLSLACNKHELIGMAHACLWWTLRDNLAIKSFANGFVYSMSFMHLWNAV